MTLELTREDFAHMPRLRLDPLGWVRACPCGWISEPAAEVEDLPIICPRRGQPVSPKAEDWFPPTVGTHFAGRRIEQIWRTEPREQI